VFTTPWCASCDTVTSHLSTAEPDSRVVKVDATRHVDLADAFHIRTAPTVLLADALGTVQQRLVGAAAVSDYVRIGQ
jgi:thioredoxin-like negative regulator of GroEL